MGTVVLERRFAAIGARVKVIRTARERAARIDVGFDRRGEFFELRLAGSRSASFEVVDADPDDRCLLLLVREAGEKSKFLCGFDERHWFVAAIPESARGVTGVVSAKDALQPDAVREAVARVRPRDRFRRRNAAYVRQGEWFFLPVPGFAVDEKLVLPSEPLRRGNGGKPHWAEFCYRTGGETVYVCSRHPNGVTEAQYKGILAGSPKAKGWGWRTMRRNPGVYVKGRIRHADHATITLHGWHQVVMNTEGQSKAMRNVAFLD